MSVGDVHVVGPNGYALCEASGPLRGYNATSSPCRDCASRGAQSSSSGWTVAGSQFPISRAMPYFGGNQGASALLRKRPARLVR